MLLGGLIRAVGRYESPGVSVLFGGHNLPPLLEIGLTDLPKFWGRGTPRDDRPVNPMRSLKDTYCLFGIT